jgi:pimeloyl-ACP methyl ester carboxylesterase
MHFRQWLWVLGVILLGVTGWFLATDNPMIWPIRNTLQYHLMVALTGPITTPAAEAGSLVGTVLTPAGQPVPNARVLVAHRSGTTYQTSATEAGDFSLTGIPPGLYRPVAGAPNFQSTVFGSPWGQVRIRPNRTTTAHTVLQPVEPNQLTPGTNLMISAPVERDCTEPLQEQALESEVTFNNNGVPNQPAYYYTPPGTTSTDQLPLLLVIYPGPAESWSCASVPLASAGYAVLATGPAYSFDLEADLDELQRLLAFAQKGRFPGSSHDQLALLGGSYSSLHVLRLLQRGQTDVQAALLLGPPTDLFEMRRQLETGKFVPPFGLDQALIALGLPDQESLRYWQYSGAYHVSQDFPPLAVLHSRSDEVVPYQQSELLVENLERVGANYEAYYFDGASHYLLAVDGGAEKLFDIANDFLARNIETR